MNEEKKFIIPVMEIIVFSNDDIIFTSGETDINGSEIEDLA